MKNFLPILLIALFQSGYGQKTGDLLRKAFQSADSSDYYFKLAKRSIKSEADLAEYFFCKNARHTDFGNQDSAIYYGNLAVAKYKKLNDYNKLLYVYNNLGKTYIPRGNYEKALEIYFQGLKIAEQQKDHFWIIQFYRMISNTYHDFEDFEKGVEYGKKGYEAFLKSPQEDRLEGLGPLSSIAINFDDWNKPDSALHYHYKIIDVVKGSKDTLSMGGTYNNIGNTLLKQKKFTEARKWIEGAIRIGEATKAETDRLRYFYDRATYYTNLATIAYSLNEFDKAEQLFKVAFEASTGSKSVEKLRDYYYHQYLFNKKRNNIDKAFFYQDEYLKIRDSVFKLDRAKTFASLEARYQNEKKEKQLLKSNAEIALASAEIKKKNTQFMILGLISISLLAIISLVYRQQKLKNRQMAQEHELKSAIARIETQNILQDQRLRISRDLHDNIGSQLTFIISSVDNIRYAFNIADMKLDTKLTSISNFAKETIVELRDTIWAMNKSEVSIEDLQTRIMNFIEKAKESHESTDFEFNTHGVSDIVLTSVEGMNVYRTIQEAVNNALKHAQASLISVSIVNDENSVRIAIKDNGVGFSIGQSAVGNGTSNMEKRIGDIGGKLDIWSVPGNGTEISFRVEPSLQKITV